ncbi:MAG: hypothetical protein AAB472_02950 [Patescibacteria group bacterium]
MSLDSIISIGFYLSSLGFLIATVITLMARSKVGASGLGSVLSYLFIGTGTFFVITIFQGLGGDFFGISDESMDIWWHIMFYLAMFSYYFGFKALTKLGSDEADLMGSKAKSWGIFSIIVLVVVFLIPGMADSVVEMYSTSILAGLGLHHFLAFALAGTVGSYLMSAKKNLGQIGQAIANPMIIAVLALSIQHFWELLFESWKIVVVTSEVGEGIEKIFLITAATCVTVAALRLKSLAKAS